MISKAKMKPASGIRNLNTNDFSMAPSPSPRPSPLGKGRHARRLLEQRDAADWRRTGERFSLSPRERAGVRGNKVLAIRIAALFSGSRGHGAQKARGPLSWERSLRK